MIQDADLVIVGGGPAGLTAAIYTARMGLNTIMFEAEDYYDFVMRLFQEISTEKANPELVYFTIFHAYNMDMYNDVHQYFENYDLPPFTEPLVLAIRAICGESIDMDYMNESLVDALKNAPNDWLACHMYLAWRRIAESIYPETDTDVTTGIFWKTYKSTKRKPNYCH